MPSDHVCTVCFRLSVEHVDLDHIPPLCCHGCGCGEEASDE
jgi:hypothetical protein